MKKAIDLYSGIGGWTLGMKLSGIENVASFEWWKEANNTHNLNFDTNHKEFNIRNLRVPEDLDTFGKIDFVVGSPPCTQFSFANRGGNGDIADGLIDIYKFLEVVEHLKPKYWAMENVPRVAGILKEQLQPGGQLNRFRHLFTVVETVDSSEYGVPQSRKRMIAGHFPIELFLAYKSKVTPLTLGDVLQALSKDIVIDPNYGYELTQDQLTDYENEHNLTLEEERINRDSKTFHPVYNKMSFPEKLDKPARTITATCTRVSRESIVIKSDLGYRRLNVRERGVIQGFPITYQFYGKTLSSKFKMIGNAVPPILTYFIFQSMLEVPVSELQLPKNSPYYHKAPNELVPQSKFDKPTNSFSQQRKFMFAVPNLRFGSGVRFELSNTFSKVDKASKWSFKFFFGNSKEIKQICLDQDLYSSLLPFLSNRDEEIVSNVVDDILEKYPSISSESLQNSWISKSKLHHPFDFIDFVGECSKKLQDLLTLNFKVEETIENILNGSNKKAIANGRAFMTGFLLLSKINIEVFDKELNENRSKVLAS